MMISTTVLALALVVQAPKKQLPAPWILARPQSKAPRVYQQPPPPEPLWWERAVPRPPRSVLSPSISMSSIAEKYDRFEDRTSLRADLGEDDKGSKLSLSLTQAFDGKDRTTPVGDPVFTFRAYTDGGSRYRENHSVIFLVDGQRMPLQATHQGKVVSPIVIEDIYAELKSEQLAVLAAARTIEVRVGKDEILFGPSVRWIIAEFIECVENPQRSEVVITPTNSKP